jgi:hypothetical protein
MFLKERKNEWVTTTQIREENFVNGNFFSKWFKESIEHIKQKLFFENLDIVEDKNGKSGRRFKVLDLVTSIPIKEIDKGIEEGGDQDGAF